MSVFSSPKAMAITDWDTFNEPLSISVFSDDSKIAMNEDPIAISCVMYRLRTNEETLDNRPSYTFSLKEDAKTLAKSITQEDRLLAQAIRTYYNGKLVVARLRGNALSKYRQDLSSLLLLIPDEYNNYQVPEKFFGMIYKLPYFYEYDRALIDTVFDGEYFTLRGPRSIKSAELKFVTKLSAYRKALPRSEYWFTDKNDNRVVLFVDKHNPIDQLFDEYVRNNDILVEGNFSSKTIDNLNFYIAGHWNLILK